MPATQKPCQCLQGVDAMKEIERVVCDKVVCDKAVCNKVVCDKRTARAGGRAGGQTGMHNQKQEPHTKMWGINCHGGITRGKGFFRYALCYLFHAKTGERGSKLLCAGN